MSETEDNSQNFRRVVLVDGLPAPTTEAMLWKHFSQFAALTSVKIVRDPLTGESNGYAYIILEDPNLVTHVMNSEHKIMQKPVALHMPSRKGERRVWKYDLLHRRLYVSCLPEGTTEADLFRTFSQYARVQLVHMAESSSGRSKRCGYIDFERECDAARVLMRPIFIYGTKITVANTKKTTKQLTLSVQTRTQDDQFLSADSSNQSKKEKVKILKILSAKSPKPTEIHQTQCVQRESRLLQSELSNYQCLNLNPWVFVNIVGLVPLSFALKNSCFDLGFVAPLTKSHLINGDLRMLQLKQSLAMVLPKPKSDQGALRRTERSKRMKFVVGHKLEQDVSNYIFRLERPRSYLIRKLAACEEDGKGLSGFSALPTSHQLGH